MSLFCCSGQSSHVGQTAGSVFPSFGGGCNANVVFQGFTSLFEFPQLTHDTRVGLVPNQWITYVECSSWTTAVYRAQRWPRDFKHRTGGPLLSGTWNLPCRLWPCCLLPIPLSRGWNSQRLASHTDGQFHTPKLSPPCILIQILTFVSSPPPFRILTSLFFVFCPEF